MSQNIVRLTKSVKKLEKPRPLKLSSSNQNRQSITDTRITSVDDVMTLVDNVSMHIVNGNCDKTLQANIFNLCANLKIYGQQLEAVYKDQLDRAFITFRNGCKDERLDASSRAHMLEIIELRASNWNLCDNMLNYYKPKFSSIDTETVTMDPTVHVLNNLPFATPTTPITTPLQAPLLSPGEVIKTSGKFAKPTKIPGKNYCKDEVVIRNSDSGKVMGIKGRRVHMIEELSETIISFQRVSPGAKERLVQITGPAEEKINYAKQLMEETIRRNASPVRLEHAEKERVGGSSSSLNSSASDDSNRLSQGMNRSKLLHSFSTNDATLGEYKYTVNVGNTSVKITGSNLDIVRTAKLVLDEFFSGEIEQIVENGDFFTIFQGEQPLSPVAPVNFAMAGRVGSMDSSESEETYKVASAPTPAAEERAQDFSIIRHMYPADQYAESESSSKRDDVQSENDPDENLIAYTRQALLQMAISSYSSEEPADWDQISKECPAIVKKAVERFDPVVYSQKWQELEAHSIICATEVDLADQE